MTLARKIARLEVLVAAKSEPTVPTFWTPERIEQWRAWVVRLLETMPEDWARQVFEELTTLPADQWGPVTRRVHDMACAGADGRYDCTGWPHWADRAIALPEAVCAALEQHPGASFTFDWSCEQCGLEVPHLPYAGPALLTACPLCDGKIKRCGYTHRRYREDWERQKAEAAGAG